MNKLGFGFLRLPEIEGAPKKTYDFDLLNEMVDYYIENGGKYFDTAYTYLGGMSEEAIKRCVVNRYPRDKFILADKLPGYKAKSGDDCDRFFEEQLKRCNVDFFDVYMLHWLNKENYEIAQKYDEFGFLRSLKEAGKARKIGFSFHDTAPLLDKILTEHHEIDYVQLQINYLDWDSPAIQARECYEVAKGHGKKVIVMEPVKGGTLSKVPEKAAEILGTIDPAMSPSLHALRFAQSLNEVEYVLSGMSDMAQVVENIRDVLPMKPCEMEKLERVAQIINGAIEIPCTACGYCLGGCPRDIPIPEYFKLYNEYKRDEDILWKITPAFGELAAAHGKAKDCIACLSCENSCPQRLPITENLKKVSQVFEKG